eukprot:scpid48439/ scgid28574/ 
MPTVRSLCTTSAVHVALPYLREKSSTQSFWVKLFLIAVQAMRQHKNQYAALNKVLMFVCLMVNGMSSTESNGSAGLRQPQQGGRPSNSGDGTWHRSRQRGPGDAAT